MATEHKFGANQIAEALGKKYQLTEEQVAAVEQASVTSPVLVVAGAGSGKTDLMSVRVPWLVANGYARPEEILGLTFTRKAAGELSKRVYESLIQLRDQGQCWPVDLEADFTAPNISTYNAYANSLFRDFALPLGYESDAIQLTEASAYQFARDLLLSHGSSIDSNLAELDLSLNELVEKVLSLAQSMNENLVTESQITSYLDGVAEHIASLPKKVGGDAGDRFGYIEELLMTFKETKLVANLASEFLNRKLLEGRIDYSDQVALAERAVRTIEEVSIRERANYKHVLLDEYQDTSFLQTRLLSGLFFGHSVFAVGDPNQSIYGWRGASASNLSEFAQDFSSKPIDQFSLQTSWRNPVDVLRLANHLSAPLATPASYLSATQRDVVSRLKVVELKPSESAGAGVIEYRFEQNMNEEAKQLAEWFKQKFAQDDKTDKTAALLLRKRTNMKLFVDELQKAGLEVEVVGLGGLLEMPEIVDIVATLAVLVRPDAGSQLIRLLTGARWRIGAKDIDGLYGYSRWLARTAEEFRANEGVGTEDSASLVDALDRLADDKLIGDPRISESGLARMKDAARLLRAMRGRIGLPLAELVRAITAELQIDIELLANPSRKNPLIHVNEFISVVANFSAANNHATVGSLLEYLEFAAERERLEAPRSKAKGQVIQVLTVHGAKGLEWNYVAIPNMVEKDFPAAPRSLQAWLSSGQMPYALRGDAKTLPSVDFSSATVQKEVKDAKEIFTGNDIREMLASEERRLIYVAITRPKNELLLTGSYWKPGASKPAEPSSFLLECLTLDNSPVVGPNEIAEVRSTEPELSKADQQDQWPKPPFSSHRQAKVESAATATEAAIESGAKLLDADLLAKQIHQLLQERDSRNEQRHLIDFPVRISASRFKDYLSDLDAVAENTLRPLPQPPYRATRAGNLFHAWIEKQFAAQLGSGFDFEDLDQDSIDGNSIDDSADFESIEDLQKIFAKSPWAGIEPDAVEQEIQLTIGQNTFVCKMDAIFKTANGFEVVDWKTNAPPKDKKDLDKRSLQLALYRLAYARFTGRPIDEISASFYFVGANQVLKPADLLSEQEILDAWNAVLEQLVVED